MSINKLGERRKSDGGLHWREFDSSAPILNWRQTMVSSPLIIAQRVLSCEIDSGVVHVT
jgi:hypothetical protein